MKKWLLALLLIPTLSFGKGLERVFPVNNFSKGVDTYHSPLTLPDGYVQDSLNVFFDQTSPAEKRRGFNTVLTSGTFSYTGLWHYTDTTNTSWIIARSSNTILASNLSGTTVKIATVSVNNTVNEVNAFGSAYFVDQTQGVYYWNGTSTTYVSGSPKGSLIEQFHGRLWVAGQAIPNGNILNSSKYLDGTVWTTGTNAIDPVQFTIDLGDNYDVLSALYGSVNDTLYLFKQFSVSALYGFDQTDFQTRQLNREDGCADSRSIQAYNKGLVLMGSKGIEYFDGYAFNRISDPIKNKVTGALQSTFNQQSWSQSTQSDFQSGSSSPTSNISFTVSPGDVVLSTFGSVDTSSSDFAQGTSVNVDYTSVPGSVILSTDSNEILNNSLETNGGIGSCSIGNFTNGTACASSAWGAGSGGTVTGSGDCGTFTLSPYNGSWYEGITGASLSDTFHVQLRNAKTSSVISSFNNTAAACTWTEETLSGAGTRGLLLNIYTYEDSRPSDYEVSDNFVGNGNDVKFFYTSFNTFSSPSQRKNLIDYFHNTPRSSITTGNFTSRVFDTGFSSSGYLIPSNTTTSNTTAPTFVVQQATSSTGAWSDLTTSTGSSIFLGSRYLRYISTFTIAATDNALGSLDSASFSETASSGIYYSAVHNTTSMNSWGNFVANNSLNGGAITYYVRSATSSFSTLSSTPAWTLQSNNSNITISTGAYFQMASTFTITSSTQAPTLNDFTFGWFSGTKSAPMASAVYDNRYWLSLTTNTADSQNDATVVLNRSGIWSILSIPAGAFTLSRGTLYHADANSTGNIYQDDIGYNDNGTAIDAYIQTKDYSIDDWTHDDFFYDLWIAADNSGPYSISSSYYVDGATTAYTLSSALENEKTGRLYLKLPIGIDSTHQNFASSISFKFEEADNNAPWKFYGAYLNYKQRPVQ